MRRFKRKDGMQVWAGEISGGFVVIIYNRDTQPHDISVPFEEIFLDDLETNWHKGKTLEFVDLWALDGENTSLIASESLRVRNVPARGVKVYSTVFAQENTLS